ncbi:NAD(P)H-dependent oxidoreductase [Parapedobacter sp. ISTM3]|uniref:NAD(P)H dehydrogenase (Quinone) n=1 Tax=Parapedobacter luteus TaxID=623280 RepID=A0A1T5B1I2_9SPHI|nr:MULTISPECIES: NAD(P)H-dependent oxidoreductase [Parapedobacter]MBK1440424.1 NAD(P)H-dependent oxidoreductase [Parapedobacter sp. ISTM3]SKB40830.1 NAD(P)H dehydrogenase (quinone) [Parapedobacter luteus]
MRHLIIYAHPHPQSLNGRLTQKLALHLSKNGHDIKVRDLYRLDFNPVLSLQDMEGQRAGKVADDVRKEQEFIQWADCITIIHPIWWTGLPAIIKGYIDRVFSYGFAYRYDQGIQKGLLTEKAAVIINTHGKSQAEYEAIGMDRALSLTSDTGIYAYCGLTVKRHFFLDKADRATDTRLEHWIKQINEVYDTVFIA